MSEITTSKVQKRTGGSALSLLCTRLCLRSGRGFGRGRQEAAKHRESGGRQQKHEGLGEHETAWQSAQDAEEGQHPCERKGDDADDLRVVSWVRFHGRPRVRVIPSWIGQGTRVGTGFPMGLFCELYLVLLAPLPQCLLLPFILEIVPTLEQSLCFQEILEPTICAASSEDLLHATIFIGQVQFDEVKNE